MSFFFSIFYSFWRTGVEFIAISGKISICIFAERSKTTQKSALFNNSPSVAKYFDVRGVLK